MALHILNYKTILNYILSEIIQRILTIILTEAGHMEKEAMKDVLLSTISVTLNVIDETGNKLIDSDYLNAIRNIVNKIEK